MDSDIDISDIIQIKIIKEEFRRHKNEDFIKERFNLY